MDGLAASGLSKEYRTKNKIITAIKNIDLRIKSGEFLAITGESGSGKSTLLQLLGGLEPTSSGTITFNDTNVTKMSDEALSHFRNKTFGFIFQNFYLQPFLTVRQNVELTAVFANKSKKDRAERTIDLSKLLGLEDKLDNLPRELSGGQIQRTAILRALYNSPSVIFADEPTGNLDRANATLVLDLLQKINNELGTTIVLVTHDDFATNYASRVITLKNGEMHETR